MFVIIVLYLCSCHPIFIYFETEFKKLNPLRSVINQSNLINLPEFVGLFQHIFKSVSSIRARTVIICSFLLIIHVCKLSRNYSLVFLVVFQPYFIKFVIFQFYLPTFLFNSRFQLNTIFFIIYNVSSLDLNEIFKCDLFAFNLF